VAYFRQCHEREPRKNRFRDWRGTKKFLINDFHTLIRVYVHFVCPVPRGIANDRTALYISVSTG